MEEKLMKIGEIAAFFGVSAKAIRIYEKKGIIIPAKIDPDTGYRYYTADQVQSLNALLELKSLGFSLDEVKNIMSGAVSHEDFIAALKRKQIALQEAISVLENKICSIDKISERLYGSQEAKKLHELPEEKRAWLLVKMACVEDLRAQSVLSEALWL
ncbi:MAG: MerR family transcriptional regulator [Oscillospiraceae bacterium]|jgi:DNA-binding transcriptional MerR regulator|nr:MerR family transcriptional regulator [Oscillospiraceae bacterium]